MEDMGVNVKYSLTLGQVTGDTRGGLLRSDEKYFVLFEQIEHAALRCKSGK